MNQLLPRLFKIGMGLAAGLTVTLFVLTTSDAQVPAGNKNGKSDTDGRSQLKNPDRENGPEALARQREMNAGNPDIVGSRAIGEEALKGITRTGPQHAQAAIDRGMIPTGLTPKFKAGVYCRDVDDGWAQEGGGGKGGTHGGIDIPMPRGTPVRAIAAGEVVNKGLHGNDPQGIQIWLRHSPEDTGLTIWSYSQYAHLLELPEFPLGHRVRMGEAIGKTSNTGTGGGKRRDALHFAIVYSDSRKFFVNDALVVPLDGRWMDPIAIYRNGPPFDSQSMKALPANQKQIAIPFMLEDGTTVPADTKLIWPYFCSKAPLPWTKLK
jgi:murein DD-endopeptidase MepM/ murein hydrolase activator NlpD